MLHRTSYVVRRKGTNECLHALFPNSRHDKTPMLYATPGHARQGLSKRVPIGEREAWEIVPVTLALQPPLGQEMPD